MPAISLATTSSHAKAKRVFGVARASCFSLIGKNAAIPGPLSFPLGRGLLHLALGELQIAAIGRPSEEYVLNEKEAETIARFRVSLVDRILN